MKTIIQSQKFDLKVTEDEFGFYEVKYGLQSKEYCALDDAMQEFVYCLNHSMICESIEVNWPNGGESILDYED